MGTEFNKEQFEAIYPVGIERHYWTLARNKIIADTLRRGGQMSGILEVGCGRGIVCGYLRSRGFSVKGVELSTVEIPSEYQDIVESGKDVFDLEATVCDTVRTILLLDVIEHIEKPQAFLISLRNHFPKLENFLITVPARQEIFSNYDIFNGHFRRYHIQTLLYETDKFPGATTKVCYMFHALYAPARLLKVLRKNRSEQIRAPKRGLPTLVHKILSFFFYCEYKILPSHLPGTSLILTVRMNPENAIETH